MDVVADFRRPPDPRWRPRRALDLTEDAAILTAIANDIGIEAIFARQVIAHGREGDALLAISTSGNSANVIAALAEARSRGLRTIAMVGYDGGRVAAERLADHVVVTRSEHIPRIQEAQASAYHVLRELVREGESGVSRVRARVEGTVQGVGFRPYVYRLAGELGVAGHVLNDSRGVVVEVEAPAETVERFLARLPAEAPPLATVERVTAEPLEELGERGLLDPGEPRRAASRARRSRRTAPPARTAWPSCSTRRTGASATRSRTARTAGRASRSCATSRTTGRSTTMAGFTMCPACRAEYEDPADRRFHAQPNACPDCGPRARLTYAGGGAVRRPRRRRRRRGGRARASRRGDRRREGHRRVPPRLRWHATRRRSPSCGPASTARTSRSR